jgi:hypothetical protein
MKAQVELSRRVRSVHWVLLVLDKEILDVLARDSPRHCIAKQVSVIPHGMFAAEWGRVRVPSEQGGYCTSINQGKRTGITCSRGTRCIASDVVQTV